MVLGHSLTATTLALGEAPSPAPTPTESPGWGDDRNLHECVVLNPDTGINRSALVIQWVESRGPSPGSKATCGFDLEVNEIFDLLQAKEAALNQLATLEETYEKQRVQIHKAEKIQLAKWSPKTKDALHMNKVRELDSWVTAKVSEAFVPVSDHKDVVEKTKKKLDGAIASLLDQLSHYDPLGADEDCQELVRELASKFGKLTSPMSPSRVIPLQNSMLLL